MAWSRILASVTAITVACVASAALYHRRNRKREVSEVNEVMVFCKLQYNVCNYFERLIGFVERAKSSIAICMPGLQNMAIQGRLVRLLKQKNLAVEIIIDKSGYNEWSTAFLKELTEAGAEIKWRCGDFNMCHKFCLIDESVLMTGTLDWGDDRAADDWNYVLITSQEHLVQPVKKQFRALWDVCEFKLS